MTVFQTNATITFVRKITQETKGPVKVFIDRATRMSDPRKEDGTPLYDCLMVYPATVTWDSDGTLPGLHDYLRCSELFDGDATIGERPDRLTQKLFRIATLYFCYPG